MAFIILGAIVLVLLIVVAITVYALRIKSVEFKKTGEHPEGHYMGIGISYGLAMGMMFGIASGVVIDKPSLGISIGPAMGMGFGVAIGSYLEKKHKGEERPLTEKEKHMRKIMTFVGIGIAFLGVIAFLSVFFLARN